MKHFDELMASLYGDSATYDTSSSLFNSVLEHRVKFQDVSNPQGAFAFNQAFNVPVDMDKIAPPKLTVEVIDAVKRSQKVGLRRGEFSKGQV